jgi:hypothetical protein
MPQPENNKQGKVIADVLHVRSLPTTESSIIGKLHRDDLVTWSAVSDNGKWLSIQFDGAPAWISKDYVAAYTAPGTGAGNYDTITHIVNSSNALLKYEWKDRGRAPKGYLQGMALVFARQYCRLKANNIYAMEMAKAKKSNPDKDALAHYAPEFAALNMNINADGADTLRHLFVLLIGLGMRESSGRYCEGRDRAAENTSAQTAEAGLFQTSYNATGSSSVLLDHFIGYEDHNKECFKNIFSTGIHCTAKDLENFGDGAGLKFQQLSKDCPAFAAEFAALGLRFIRGHWGPVVHKKAELRPECNEMLLAVQAAADNMSSILL